MTILVIVAILVVAYWAISGGIAQIPVPQPTVP